MFADADIGCCRPMDVKTPYFFATHEHSNCRTTDHCLRCIVNFHDQLSCVHTLHTHCLSIYLHLVRKLHLSLVFLFLAYTFDRKTKLEIALIQIDRDFAVRIYAKLQCHGSVCKAECCLTLLCRFKGVLVLVLLTQSPLLFCSPCHRCSSSSLRHLK